MTRYAFVVTDLFGGGAQKSLIDIASGLASRGHHVRVFTLRERIEFEIPQQVDVVNLKVVNRLTKSIRMRAIEAIQEQLIERALKGFSPDITLACACHRIMRHSERRDLYMWVKIDLNTPSRKGKEREKWNKRYASIYKNHKCLAPTLGVKKSLINVARVQKENITVIPNGFDDAELNRLADASLPNIGQSLPEEYFLSVGTLERRKRYDWMLRAYSKSEVDLPLVIIGKGSTQQITYISEQAEKYGVRNKVFLLGFFKNPYPIIRSARAVIMTSEREGLPRAIIESLILKTPVVSFDCPSGPADVLTGKLKTWLIPLGDCGAMGKAIRDMAVNPPTIKRGMYERFLYENVLDRFENLANDEGEGVK